MAPDGSPLPPLPPRPPPTLSTIAALIAAARRIVVLAGAGISVSAGLPDFRSPDGLYAALGATAADPAALFHIDTFREDPAAFFAAAAHLLPPPAVAPTPAHRFLADLWRRSKLRRVYTQNIDGLEGAAGVGRVVAVHGSWAGATCTRCGVGVGGGVIAPTVRAGRVPYCTACLGEPTLPRPRPPGRRRRRRSFDNDSSSDDGDGTATPAAVGIMKPDIVLFGESLPAAVAPAVEADVKLGAADLVLVMGTSLAVAPVSTLPALFPPEVPRVLFNRMSVVPPGGAFDIVALGDCDAIVGALREALGWEGGG